ncbi:MAG: hypothetical protein ACK4Q5_12730 [Saprospiraceae bacterium]
MFKFKFSVSKVEWRKMVSQFWGVKNKAGFGWMAVWGLIAEKNDFFPTSAFPKYTSFRTLQKKKPFRMVPLGMASRFHLVFASKVEQLFGTPLPFLKRGQVFVTPFWQSDNQCGE